MKNKKGKKVKKNCNNNKISHDSFLTLMIPIQKKQNLKLKQKVFTKQIKEGGKEKTSIFTADNCQIGD